MLTESIPQSKLLAAVLNEFAKKYPMLKILKIPGDQCIEGYPDKLMPTLLVYGPREYRGQVVGLAELGGNNTRVPGLTNLWIQLTNRLGEICREDRSFEQGWIKSYKGRKWRRVSSWTQSDAAIRCQEWRRWWWLGLNEFCVATISKYHIM